MNHLPPSSTTNIMAPPVVGHASLDGLPEILRNKILMEYIGGIRDRGNVASYFDPPGIGIDGDDTDESERSCIIGSGNHVTTNGDENCDDSAGGTLQGGDVEMQSEGEDDEEDDEEDEENDCESVESGESLVANSHYNAFINEMPTLMRLASTSKSWSRWIYRDMPDLWRDINADALFRSAKDEMTDAWLGNFLRWINARMVVQTLNLSGCDIIMGPGLDPIRGSTILRKFHLDWTKNGGGMHSDGKTLISIVESLVPDGLRSVATTSIERSPLVLLTLPDSENYGVSGGRASNPSATEEEDDIVALMQWPPKKKAKHEIDVDAWSYADALKGLQRRYRKHFYFVKSGLLCADCSQSQLVWLHSKTLNHIEIVSVCVKCKCATREKMEEELEAKREASGEASDDYELYYNCLTDLDLGILDVLSIDSCPSTDRLNAALVCSTCDKDDDYITCHMYPDRVIEARQMEICSKCKIPCCKNCSGYSVSSEEFAIREYKSEYNRMTLLHVLCSFKGYLVQSDYLIHSSLQIFCYLECGVVSCGICSDFIQCGSHISCYVNPWYCSDCDVVKRCARCDSLRCCDLSSCAIFCTSCKDSFCFGEGYEPCSLSASYCRICKNWFCSKDGCPRVTKCRSDLCSRGACDVCISTGKAENVFLKCARCEDYHCDDKSNCLDEHKNQKCRKVDHEARRASEERRLAFYAGRCWLP